MPAAFTHPKHTEWIVTSYLAGGIRLYEDILARVHDVLDIHAKLFRKNILSPGTAGQPWTDERNVLNYCGLRGCTTSKKGTPFKKPGLEVLQKIYSEHLASLVAPVYKPDPGTLYYEGQDVKIYKLSNQDEACYYGQGTRWCTAASKHNMFDEYNKDNELYVIVPIRPQYKGEKYQISVERNWNWRQLREYQNPNTGTGISDLMDEKDEEVGLDELIVMYPEITQIQRVEQYALYGYIRAANEIDNYTYYLRAKGQVISVLRVKDEIIDVGIVDEVAEKINIIQGTFEGLIDGLVLVLSEVKVPWLAKLLYPYRPTQVIPSTWLDTSCYNAAIMLSKDPLIMVDAVENHYDSVYRLLIYYFTRLGYLDGYDHTVKNLMINIINTVANSHYPNLATNEQLSKAIYPSIASWTFMLPKAFEHEDIQLGKLSKIIRTGIKVTYPGKDQHGLDRLERDLYDKLLIFFHQEEDKFLEKTYMPYIPPSDWRMMIEIVKTLYTALSLTGKPLPPKVVRYSQLANEWLKIHKV
jgi:hypothetical protein